MKNWMFVKLSLFVHLKRKVKLLQTDTIIYIAFLLFKKSYLKDYLALYLNSLFIVMCS